MMDEGTKTQVRFAVLMGVVDSSITTGLRAGKESDALVDAIMEKLEDPSLGLRIKHELAPKPERGEG
jgi:hypothetical protein